jgi:hypothetical protein
MGVAMNRALALVLIASFALFAGSPAVADIILGPSDGTGTGAAQDAPGSETSSQAAQGQDQPDQSVRVGTFCVVIVAAAVVFAGAVYFFGATATPHPGW